MKAGELFHLLSSAQCGDEVLIRWDGAFYELDTVYDASEGKFIIDIGCGLPDEEDDEE